MSNSGLTSLLYFLAFGLLFYWIMRKGGCGMHSHGNGGHGGHGGNGGHGQRHDGAGLDERRGDVPPRQAKDPVCGMDVEPARAAGTRAVRGRTFYLCSADCLAKFDSDPDRFATAASEATAAPRNPHQTHHGS